MLRRAPIIILLTVAALAGCGPAAGQDSTEGFSGPPAEVVATVEALQEAASSRDAQTVCSNLLATSVQDARKRIEELSLDAAELEVTARAT